MKEINAVLIPGDITNNVNDLEDRDFRALLQEELLSLTQEKPVFVSYGNHDLMAKNNKEIWIPGKKELLKKTIEELPNYHFISNGQRTKQNDITISVCSPNYGYYESKKNKNQRENPEDYSRIFYANYNENLFDETTYNIFLTHEPQSIIKLSKEKGSCIQPNTDLVVSGHMHNGLLPNFMQPFMANRGLNLLRCNYSQNMHKEFIS